MARPFASFQQIFCKIRFCASKHIGMLPRTSKSAAISLHLIGNFYNFGNHSFFMHDCEIRIILGVMSPDIALGPSDFPVQHSGMPIVHTKISKRLELGVTYE